MTYRIAAAAIAFAVSGALPAQAALSETAFAGPEAAPFEAPAVAALATDEKTLKRQLKRMRDDGTLNPQDDVTIRLRTAFSDDDEDALERRLKRQRDDGTLNPQDYITIRHRRT